jgi:hypothetical protein
MSSFLFNAASLAYKEIDTASLVCKKIDQQKNHCGWLFEAIHFVEYSIESYIDFLRIAKVLRVLDQYASDQQQ